MRAIVNEHSYVDLPSGMVVVGAAVVVVVVGAGVVVVVVGMVVVVVVGSGVVVSTVVVLGGVVAEGYKIVSISMQIDTLFHSLVPNILYIAKLTATLLVIWSDTFPDTVTAGGTQVSGGVTPHLVNASTHSCGDTCTNIMI